MIGSETYSRPKTYCFVQEIRYARNFKFDFKSKDLRVKPGRNASQEKTGNMTLIIPKTQLQTMFFFTNEN